MQLFSIHLSYLGSAWVKLPLEVGHDKICGSTQVEARVAPDIFDLFAAVGLPEPPAGSAPFARPPGRPEAARLHAAGCQRRQLAARRLFAARRAQEWPPTVVAFPGWEAIYAEAADGLDAIGDVDDAVAWANDLITRIG